MAMVNEDTHITWLKRLQSDAVDKRSILQEIFNKCHLLPESSKAEVKSSLVFSIRHSTSQEHPTKAGLDLAYKSYYKIKNLEKEDDQEFLPYIEQFDLYQQSFILYAVLFTEYHRLLRISFLQEKCENLLEESIKTNSKNLLIVLRTANLFLEEYGGNNIQISIEKLYFCLQTHINGLREETLKLFEQQTRNFQNASETFNTLISYWPWSNKYKFYFLASIISNHKIEALTSNCGEFAMQNFFHGMRLSLVHKSLFSGGQALARALLKHNGGDFQNLVCTILKEGTEKEISNFNSQWGRLVQQKEEVFKELNLPTNCKEALLEIHFAQSTYKFVVICNMLLQQFSQDAEFASFVDYLITNCFKFELNTQLEVFKLVVGYLTNSEGNVSASLDFIIMFLANHMFVPCSDFRHTTVGKFTTILNFIAKLHNNQCSPELVKTFFKDLLEVCYNAMSEKEYQPLSFSLKLILVSMQCLFVKEKKRISKKLNATQNQNLGQYLLEENIWSSSRLQRKLLDLLKRSADYDDIRELIIAILSLTEADCFEECLEACKAANSNCDIDKCFLSSYFLRIAIDSSKKYEKLGFPCDFFTKCVQNLTESIEQMEKDPLFACKSGMHLFGYINSINQLCADELCRSTIPCILENFVKIIEIVEIVLQLILDFLNAADKNSESPAASFEVMDESLELLVRRSRYTSADHPADRKFLLLSFWMSLKACCDIATTLGIYFSRSCEANKKNIEFLEKCLWINVAVLYKCRHKGAIEAAGVSLGKLVKEVSTTHMSSSPSYQLLYSIFSVLFGEVNKISTTRRGAGLSIMLHHMIKNDGHRGRPLFQHAIQTLLKYTKESKSSEKLEDEKHENFDALVLHYLCVLVRDTDLREDTFQFYDDIMMASIVKIDDKEWTVRNAALQLFGAIVPKILGQKQSVDGENLSVWEPTEVTFTEIIFALPKTCKHILQYCDDIGTIKTTSSIILFLGFLSDVSYWKKDNKMEDHFAMILKFRSLFWNFLCHKCENVRKLAAKCLARSHEFRYEIPELMFITIETFFNVTDENFLIGLIHCLIAGINKEICESKCVSGVGSEQFIKNLRGTFYQCYMYKNFSYFVRAKLVDFFILAGFNLNNDRVLEILCSKQNATMDDMRNILSSGPNKSKDFGFEAWKKKINQIYCL